MNLTACIAAFAAFYAQHEGVFNLLGIAVVVNMPRPGQQSVWYRWLFASVQSFVGSLRPHPEPPPEPKVVPSDDPTQASAQ